VLSIAGTDEELNLGEERLKIRDVWHGELHKSTEASQENTNIIKDEMSLASIQKEGRMVKRQKGYKLSANRHLCHKIYIPIKSNKIWLDTTAVFTFDTFNK
jgi:hypothetical protein